MQNCVIIGVRYNSPTFTSALANLIPAFTFLLAVIFRVSIGDNVGFLLLPLWVHSICIGYFDFKRDPNALMLSLDIELNSMVYPLVFVAKFKPLSIFVATHYIAAFLGFIFLGDSGEEGRGGRWGDGNGGDVCKKVKGLVIGGMSG
ncbi:hypothetical protein GOBAR_DD27982 [Gossypium barbadense]|nr:hypothetical protein GOBAR_DD27982 [Gossypium barbadense]